MDRYGFSAGKDLSLVNCWLASDQAWQTIEITNNFLHRAAFAQNFIAITKDEFWRFGWKALLFFNNIKRGFMRMPKNRKGGAAWQMINCVIAPFTAGNAGAIGC